MRVLVTGGSGFVGSEIVRRLVAAGHEVRVLARGSRSGMPGVEMVRGSVTERSGLDAACSGCDAVIHLVGIIAEVRGQTFERVHHEGTRNLLAAAKAVGVRRWVQMSALGSRPGAPAAYHRTKWAAEEAVRGAGIDWTIHRPSLVFGPGDGFVNFFERMSRWSPAMPLIGGGKNLLQPIAVGDVATCFVETLTRPATIGREFELCGRERISMRGVLEEILRVTGRRRMLIPVPWTVATIQGWVAERVWGDCLGRRPPLCRDQVTMLREDNIGDPGPMEAVFGFRPVGFRDGIRVYLPSQSGPGAGRVGTGAGT